MRKSILGLFQMIFISALSVDEWPALTSTLIRYVCERNLTQITKSWFKNENQINDFGHKDKSDNTVCKLRETCHGERFYREGNLCNRSVNICSPTNTLRFLPPQNCGIPSDLSLQNHSYLVWSDLSYWIHLLWRADTLKILVFRRNVTERFAGVAPLDGKVYFQIRDSPLTPNVLFLYFTYRLLILLMIIQENKSHLKLIYNKHV